MNLARGQGFEPRFLGPEPSVLPLDDPRIKLLSLVSYLSAVALFYKKHFIIKIEAEVDH